MAFATLTLARLFHGFNCRSDESIFELGFKSNKYSIYAFAAGVLLLAAVLFIPGLHGMFSLVSLAVGDVLKIAGLALELYEYIAQDYSYISERGRIR